MNEINKFLPIFCSTSYFGEKNKDKIALLSPKTSKGFHIEKTVKKEEINLHIVKVSGENSEKTDKKIHSTITSRVGKKRKRIMEVIDFLIISGQLSFEDEKAIKPIDIKTENDRTQNMLDKYKKI